MLAGATARSGTAAWSATLAGAISLLKHQDGGGCDAWKLCGIAVGTLLARAAAMNLKPDLYNPPHPERTFSRKTRADHH